MAVKLSNNLLTDFVGGEVEIVNFETQIYFLGKTESFSLSGNELSIGWAWLATKKGSSAWAESDEKQTLVPIRVTPPMVENIYDGRIMLAHQHPLVTLYPNSYYRKHTLAELLKLG